MRICSTMAAMVSRLDEAIADFEGERYADAARILKVLVERQPGDAGLRELYGLTLYRLGKWKMAIRELEAFESMTHSNEQHPVLADCHRALKQWSAVERLWDELRTAEVAASLKTEGRIVAAGALADRGLLGDAVALLEDGFRYPKRAKEHHLRRAYALADLYERAGETPRARELFSKIRVADPDFADVEARLRYLK